MEMEINVGSGEAHKGRRGPRKSKRGSRRRSDAKSGTFHSPTTVAFPRSVIGLPDRLITTLKYSESVRFSGSAAPSAQVWAINSLYDPNFGTGGHQPSYYDTFAAIYNRYFVKRVKAELTWNNNSTTVPVYVVSAYTDQYISANTVETWAESKYSIMKILAPTGSGRSSLTVTMPWMEISKLMGEPHLESDPFMYAEGATSPTDLCYLVQKVSSLDGTTSADVQTRVVLYFEAIFKDLRTEVPSLVKSPLSPNDVESDPCPKPTREVKATELTKSQSPKGPDRNRRGPQREDR